MERSLNNVQIDEINNTITKMRQCLHNLETELTDFKTKLDTMKTQFCSGFLCEKEKNVSEFKNDCQCYKCDNRFCDSCQVHEEENMKQITQNTVNKYDLYLNPEWNEKFNDYNDWQCSKCWEKEVDLFVRWETH